MSVLLDFIRFGYWSGERIFAAADPCSAKWRLQLKVYHAGICDPQWLPGGGDAEQMRLLTAVTPLAPTEHPARA
jgi:hypothetical protein